MTSIPHRDAGAVLGIAALVEPQRREDPRTFQRSAIDLTAACRIQQTNPA